MLCDLMLNLHLRFEDANVKTNAYWDTTKIAKILLGTLTSFNKGLCKYNMRALNIITSVMPPNVQ